MKVPLKEYDRIPPQRIVTRDQVQRGYRIRRPDGSIWRADYEVLGQLPDDQFWVVDPVGEVE